MHGEALRSHYLIDEERAGPMTLCDMLERPQDFALSTEPGHTGIAHGVRGVQAKALNRGTILLRGDVVEKHVRFSVGLRKKKKKKERGSRALVALLPLSTTYLLG
jgi:hypothetical protein